MFCQILFNCNPPLQTHKVSGVYFVHITCKSISYSILMKLDTKLKHNVSQDNSPYLILKEDNLILSGLYCVSAAGGIHCEFHLQYFLFNLSYKFFQLFYFQSQMIPDNTNPLLVFVNVKSGGCQGMELITSFRKLLNPHQVFNLENGGPLPG